MKKHFGHTAIAMLIGLLAYSCGSSSHLQFIAQGADVPVVLSADADSLERLAAGELQNYLSRLYPDHRFPIRHEIPERQSAILLGALPSFPELEKFVRKSDLSQPESYVVAHIETNKHPVGVIAGADGRGTLYAVYALLEELGYGFYLSYETAPSPIHGRLDFSLWNLSDSPIVGERFALNWHNFLSGCSSWNLEDWQKWISQLVKMRFNAIMVHAYGNNPMEWFSHNGESKPTGFLTTTRKGRDWGAQHVNDVRRMHGGQDVFDGPVYGADAALAPEAERVNAAVSLMRQTFEFAENRGVDVLFALDIDTFSSNPENIILTLPPGARLTVQGKPVANPDAPEGFAYYQSRVQTLLKHYPQIDQIALWFRRSLTGSLGTIWRAVQVDDFPPDWKLEYQKILQDYPALAADPECPSLFAIRKIAQAFRKALDDMDRKDVALSVGSWGCSYLPPARAFLPREIKVIPLDYDVNITDPNVSQNIFADSMHHPVAPVVWAHHDDHSYIGRPFTPFENYGTFLTQYNLTSLGIIHWTTRPLDLYFKNMSQQVWRRTLDQSVSETCLDMAERNFGPAFRESMGAYLNDWIHNAPMFGRETTDAFIDRPLANAQEMIGGCRERINRLESIDASSMKPDARERFFYFKWLEDFCLQFFQCQTALDRCRDYMKKMQINQVYETLPELQPEKAIEAYSQFSRFGGMSAGEKGILVSLNLRWLPYFMGVRQTLREESIRINFQPTHHDPLAQAPGRHTFFIDSEKNWWMGFGQKETGLQTFAIDGSETVTADSPVAQEIGQTGVLIPRKTRIAMHPFASQSLSAGQYNVQLFFVEPEFTQTGRRVFTLTMWNGKPAGSRPVPLVKDRIDIIQRARRQNHVIQFSYLIDVQDEALLVEIDPLSNPAILCGAVLKPLELHERF
ncbi:MAG: hypothetical protein JXR73_04025 [Candidatus Omnitrophica bacterium]|nr:hypothetical protein [Candidatus Omnitrophota bacterium]